MLSTTRERPYFRAGAEMNADPNAINKDAMKYKTLTQKLVQALLHYDAETGGLQWRPRAANTHISHAPDSDPVIVTQNRAEREVSPGIKGNRDSKYCYRYVRILGKTYPLNKVLWLYVFNEYPADTVINLDGDLYNIKLINLALRSSVRRDSTIIRHVFKTASGKFRVELRNKIRHRFLSIGEFHTILDAQVILDHICSHPLFDDADPQLAKTSNQS